MDESAITVRYAKAIFSLGKEKEKLSSLKRDMELISNVCRESADFNYLLKNPVIRTSEKIRLLHLIFENKIDNLSRDSLRLITHNKREIFLPDICRNVLTLIRKERNIKTATLTTATPVKDQIITRLKNLLEQELGGEVELTGNTDARIIGGLILRIDDKQYDTSVSTQLKKIKQNLLKSRMSPV